MQFEDGVTYLIGVIKDKRVEALKWLRKYHNYLLSLKEAVDICNNLESAPYALRLPLTIEMRAELGRCFLKVRMSRPKYLFGYDPLALAGGLSSTNNPPWDDGE